MSSSSLPLSTVSWHLRYYDFSFLIYMTLCLVLIGAYLTIYCLKTPTDKRITELRDIIDHDPVVTAALENLMLETEALRRRVEMEESHRARIEWRRRQWELEKERMRADGVLRDDDREPPPWLQLNWRPPSVFDTVPIGMRSACPSPASSSTIGSQQRRRRRSSVLPTFRVDGADAHSTKSQEWL